MKISVITVCYNAVATIADTLASVAAQDYPDVEHVVIDGGSTDGTQALVKREGAHVKIFVSEADYGIYDAMNKGISLATGDVIGFLNADDFYASGNVLAGVAAAFADANFDACYGDLCYVRRDDRSALVRYWKAEEFRSGKFRDGWCPPHPTFFARREVYECFGGFDLSYGIAADFELMLRFLEVRQVRAKYIPDVLVKMRMGGTTNRSLTNIFRQNVEILRALKSHGFGSSVFRLIGNKLVLRGRQYFARPVKR